MAEVNNENLSPHELDQLHSLLGRLRSQRPSSTTSAPIPAAPQSLAPGSVAIPTALAPSVSPQVQLHSMQPAVTAYIPRTQPSILPSIPAYQSARLTGGLASSSSPSFSGSMGTGYSGLSQQTPMTPIQQQLGQTGLFQQQRASFLGFEGLNTSQANQQRLASASISLPRRPSMPTRSTSLSVARRTRGRAGRPPSLSTTPTINDVIFHNVSNDTHFMRIRVKTYPPLGEYGIDYYVYRFHRDSFNEALKSNHLLFDLELPISSTIAEVMQSVTRKMQDGPLSYSFAEQGRGRRILPHEALPLGLLRIVNRGRARLSNNQIRLQAQPMMNHITLQAMTTEHASLFLAPEISFEDKRFVVFFVVMGKALKALLPVNVGEEQPRRRHSCIPQSIWVRFPNDRHDNSEPDHPETSGGETETGSSDGSDSEDDTIGDASNRTRSHARSQVGLRSTGAPLPQATGNTEILDATLPSQLWSTPWVAPQKDVESIDLSNLDTSIFEIACGFRPPKLEISGDSVIDLADRLIEAITVALDQQDFEKILSTEREFIITRTSPEGRGQILSVGRGIEREVVHLSYSRYSQQEPQWFLPRAGGYSSIAVTHSMAPVSNFRLKNLSVLGALTGLMLIHGMAPMPLSPVLIHFLIHDCNLQSIYPSFLAEWIPDLYQTLQDWLAMDHKSDISAFQPHFSIYHDMQVACLFDRDAASHTALASEMLYRAVIGPEPHTHREIQAFLLGFRMPCQRTGFNLTKIKTLIDGGSESFLNMVWTSHIKSFDDISSHLRFPLSSQEVVSQWQVVTTLLSYEDTTFEKLLRKFLKGSGVPCPKLFEIAQNHFTSKIDLSKIDDPGFRPRIFYWAATGSPSIEINGPGVSISLCGISDADYAPASQRNIMMNQGKICFKTCFNQVKVPVSYIEGLARTIYTLDAEPTSFQASFDHWLLCEFLNAIGTHSIL